MTSEITPKMLAEYQLDVEIQRLIICYQHANIDDKRVVWAALNKYAPYVPDFITDEPNGSDKT